MHAFLLKTSFWLCQSIEGWLQGFIVVIEQFPFVNHTIVNLSYVNEDGSDLLHQRGNVYNLPHTWGVRDIDVLKAYSN